MITLRALGPCAAIIVAVLVTPAAQAQTETFEGPYAGPFVGALEHHFYIETADLGTGDIDGGYYRDWDMGGGAMVGYDACNQAASDRRRRRADGRGRLPRSVRQRSALSAE